MGRMQSCCLPLVSEVCMTKLWAAAMANSYVLWGEGCSASPFSQLGSKRRGFAVRLRLPPSLGRRGPQGL